ncbi:MAG TPA: FAD-dependent oxidoreductase, partial [Tepidisphaeraceae bacterium]
MPSYNGKTTPIWSNDTSPHPRPPAPLPGEAADVCVIGAGIAGTTVAYLLAAEGKSVIVLDQSEWPQGETTRTSAHLSSIFDDRFYDIERQYDVEVARTLYESHSAAIDRIEQIARDENIDCEFRRCNAYLFPGPFEEGDELFKEFAAMRRIGVDATLVDAVPATDAGKAILARRQGAFHPQKYLNGLIAAAERRGVRFYFGKRVEDVTGAEPQFSKPARVTLYGGGETINARHVVVATNTPTPINDWLGIYIKQAAYRTYMVGLEIPAGSLPFALYWDTHDPYHYVRLKSGASTGTDVLLIGGEDHKTGQTGADEQR